MRIHCENGHATHEKRWVDIALTGQPVVHEYPAFPARLDRRWRMLCYNQPKYAHGWDKFCPGQPEDSLALMLNGIWEGYETFILANIFADAPQGSHFLDFGCRLGWFSILAAKFGLSVTAIDACEESLDMAFESAAANGLNIDFLGLHLDEDPFGPFPCYCAKIDVDGDEWAALREIYGNPRYLLVEVSPGYREGQPRFAVPGFRDDHPELVWSIMARGYDAYVVPQKPAPDVKAAFELDWMAALQGFRVPGGEAEAREFVDRLFQENLLFVRRDEA